MKKVSIIIFIIIISAFSYYKFMNYKVPYNISKDNVKSIYCKYFVNGTKIIPVTETDKEIIISEISKMTEVETNGDVGTVPYQFVIELTNGNNFTFIQDTSGVISLSFDKDKFRRKIKAPKTAEFIKRFIKENNIQLD